MAQDALRQHIWTAPLAVLVVQPAGDGPPGLLSVADLAAAAEGDKAGDLCRPLVMVGADEDLERAVLLAEECEEEILGVVDSELGRLLGLVRSADLARAYGRLLRHLRAEEHGEQPGVGR